jgi:hypothetical protein
MKRARPGSPPEVSDAAQLSDSMYDAAALTHDNSSSEDANEGDVVVDAGPSLADMQASAIRLLASRTADSSGTSFSTICSLLSPAVSASSDMGVALSGALAANPRVRIDASGLYFYRTRYAARDGYELSRLITAMGETPLLVPDLIDLFPGAAVELDARVRSGDVIRVASVDQALPDVIFSRDFSNVTCTQLSGTISVQTGSAVARTSADLTSELFRNDVVIIGGVQFRVSSQAVPVRFRAGIGNVATASMAAPVSAVLGSSAALLAEDDKGNDDNEGDEGAGAGMSSAAAIGGAAPAIGFNTSSSSGISYVSIGNNVLKTGGAFSAADTAPHELRATRTYAHPFTSRVLPLDRPWAGPSAQGLTAFRFGASGDLRALWREIVTHEAAARSAGASAAADVLASAPTGTLTDPASAIAAQAIDARLSAEAAAATAPTLSLLGGAAAFKDAPDFPPTHRLLRDAMAKAAAHEKSLGGQNALRGLGLDTHILPGTFEASAPIPTRAPRDAAERALLRRAAKPRAISVRELQLTGAEHLSAGVREAVQRAQHEAFRKKVAAVHALHAKEHDRG